MIIKKITLDYLKKEIYRLDPKTGEDEFGFKTALILLSSLVIGCNQKKISKFTKIPLFYIKPRAERLRSNGIWTGSKVCADWFTKGTGGVAFWCDVLTAEGLVKRVHK